MAPVKPDPHELLTTYVHANVPDSEVLLLAARLEGIGLEAAILDTAVEDDGGITDDAALDVLTRLLEDTPAPSIPHGDGCDAQVARARQLWLFSQPHPEDKDVHSG